MAILKISFILVIVYAVNAVVDISRYKVEYPELKSLCNKSQSDTKFDKFLDEVLTEREICYVENMNAAAARQNTSRKPLHDHEVSQKVRLFCDVIPSLINCQRNLEIKLDFCYDKNEKKVIPQSLQNETYELQTHMCMDQGKRFKPNMTDVDYCINKYVKSCFETEWDLVSKFQLNDFHPVDTVLYLSDNYPPVQKTKDCLSNGIVQCRDEKKRTLLNDSVPVHPSKDTKERLFAQVDLFANYTILIVPTP